ncbi:hypothetical protein PARMER_02482 [Parabacteroides merdae ATCC 43184]|nr:hypothetical protein PARMER_02482 [Parabacteroides merdae ATCC 43184]
MNFILQKPFTGLYWNNKKRNLMVRLRFLFYSGEKRISTLR